MQPRRTHRGTFSLQLLVVLVPVFFGLMGFAIDLGRLYLIKGELNQAASAMALASATQLIGTAAATQTATSVANQLLDDSTGHGARYNFGGNLLGQTHGGVRLVVAELFVLRDADQWIGVNVKGGVDRPPKCLLELALDRLQGTLRLPPL